MLTRENMRGLFALPVTPFDSHGRLDLGAMRENVERLVEAGFHGIVTTGTCGEFHTITYEEHVQLVKTLVDAAKGRVLTIAGCSGVNTAEAIRRTKAAEDAGVDGCMNVVPFYFTLSKKECYKYFEDLARECPNIGIVVYNNPYTTKVLLNADDFKILAQIPTLCGSKEIGDTFYHFGHLLRATDLSHMHVETFFTPSLMIGARGVMCSLIYTFPRFALELWRTCEAKQWGKALQLEAKFHDFVGPLAKELVSEGYSEPALAKAFVEAVGFLRAGDPRPPFIPVSEERRKKLRRDLQARCPELLEL